MNITCESFSFIIYHIYNVVHKVAKVKRYIDYFAFILLCHKSLVYNDLRGPGRRKPLVFNDLGVFGLFLD